MATLEQPVRVSTPEEVAAAEQALSELFLDHLETLPEDRQKEVMAELRANALALGE
jgi:hypothetical protein